MSRHLRAVDGCEAPTSPIAVVLAERHAPMRHALGELIDAEADLALIGDARDLASAEGALAWNRPAVLVVDRGLLDGPAVGGVARLCERVRPVRVVVLSTEVIPSLAERVLHAGASAFVLKEHSDVELPAAVRAAARGASFISGGLRLSPANIAEFSADDLGVLRISSTARPR